MSKSLLTEVFGVAEGYELTRTKHDGHFLRLHLDVQEDRFQCPQCGRRQVSRKGRRHRELQTVPIGLLPVSLCGPRCPTATAGTAAPASNSPPFAPAYRWLTHRLVAFVQTLAQLMCLSDVAGLTGLAWSTVKNLVKARLETDFGRPALKGLRHLSIDEIYVGKARKFYTLVIDLDTGRIVWVAQGKKGGRLKPFWRALRKAKARIQAVCCDISAAYWSAVVEHLPEAAVVFDRFHAVKLMNERLDDWRRALWREATGLMKQKVKGTRYLLLMRMNRLGDEQLPRLEAAVQANEPLWMGYVAKEMMGLIWEQDSYGQMKKFIKEWCQTAAASGIGPLQKMARTVASHAWGLLNWWKHPLSNGRMEGINNKVKAMLRQH